MAEEVVDLEGLEQHLEHSPTDATEMIHCALSSLVQVPQLRTIHTAENGDRALLKINAAHRMVRRCHGGRRRHDSSLPV